MDEAAKAVRPLVDKLCQDNGYKVGRTLTMAKACYAEGRKAGVREQRSRDHKSARWEMIGALVPIGQVQYRIKCGRCHEETRIFNGDKFRYCPKCGATMKWSVEHGCQPGGAE